MVKHIVMWTLKEEAKGENIGKTIDTLNPMFQNLIGKIDGLIKAELGENYNSGEYDLVLYTEFTSKEAEKAYQTHPLHLEIKAVVHTLVCGRACADYEI